MTETDYSSLIDPTQAKQDLAIDPHNLNQAMIDQLGFFVHYSGLAIKARRALDEAKNRLEIAESALKTKARQELTEVGGKFTEGQIDAMVKTNGAYRAAVNKVIELTEVKGHCDTVREAFEQRKYLLLQLAKDAASSAAGPLRVMAQKEGRDRLMSAMEKNAAAAA